jgi:two-component system OmpR family sensor kinase
VSVEPVGNQSVLTVADTGPGIPLPERERVFDRFYRGQSAGGAGSGLGLSIVRRIADALHATVELEDAPAGTGLVARVRFPRAVPG